MQDRPNLVFILADDLGYADLGCMGARDSAGRPADISPHIDRMAAEGVRFTRGYANSAVCSPTRFALATGRWQYRLRGAAEEPLAAAHGDKVLGLPPSHPTLASLLGDAGYATALIGKWHLGHPPHFGPHHSGYQEFFGFHSGGVDYFEHTDIRGGPDLWENETPIRRDGYLTDVLSERASDYIREQSAEKPFFLSLHYSAPHWPWLTREDREESSRTFNKGEHLDGGSVDKYQQMIHHMDEGIGRVFDALKSKGMHENTLVVFTSDNGGERFSCNWPFVGQKMDLLEGGIRVPVVARWPRQIRAGHTCQMPHLTMDWTATFLAAAGVAEDPAYPLDGVNLLPQLNEDESSGSRDLFWRMKHRSQRALVRWPWKYFSSDGHDYLFHLDRDPRERANLRHRNPEILDELRKAWSQWDAELPAIPEDAQVRLLFGEADMPKASY